MIGCRPYFKEKIVIWFSAARSIKMYGTVDSQTIDLWEAAGFPIVTGFYLKFRIVVGRQC